MSHCDRCPLRRHRRPCPARWEGCADACSLTDHTALRQSLVHAAAAGASPSAEQLASFRATLDAVPRCSVGVIVVSHNYGRYLAEALDSVLAQTVRPSEVLVVDDASDDDSAAVAERYAPRGVQYLRTEHRHCHLARRDGFERTKAEAVLFLDADNVLPPDYLQRGLVALADRDVGLVYADLQRFGLQTHRDVFPASWDPDGLERANYVDACAIYRRQALVVAQAFDGHVGHQAFADWTLARLVSRAGFVGRKNPVPLHYRVHGANMLPTTAGMSYYDRAWLESEPVTIFVPLSGRTDAWHSHLRPWLDQNDWPRDRCRLVLADTSQSPEFGSMVREWLAQSSYAAHDARYYRQSVAPPGLADYPRGSAENTAAVNDACRRIYGRMARELDTAYVLIVEDDHRPPADALRKLMRGIDEDTVAVTGLYLNRTVSGWAGPVAWKGGTAFDREIGPAEGPPIEITGSGFGTLLLRREALRRWTFARHSGDEVFYDNAFAWGVKRAGRKYKLARNVLVEHHGAPPFDSPPATDQGAAGREELRRARRARECPHRGCRTGCGSAECHVGQGDLAGGASASLRHCVGCSHNPLPLEEV